MFIFELVG